MRSAKFLEENPLTDNVLDFEEVLGFVIMASTNLGIEKNHADHLVKEMALVAEAASALIAEETYIDPAFKKDGLMSLSKWSIAKAKLNQPIDRREKFSLMGEGRLSEVMVTEIQAVGYMMLAAKNLNFLHKQIKYLEMEMHYLLVTVDPDQAYATFLDFLEE